jgi:hypothetical protein
MGTGPFSRKRGLSPFPGNGTCPLLGRAIKPIILRFFGVMEKKD